MTQTSLFNPVDVQRKMTLTVEPKRAAVEPARAAHDANLSQLHSRFQDILDLAQCRKNILLVGPSGSGKSYIAEQLACALELPFRGISCSPGMGEAQLTGRYVPQGSVGKWGFMETPFLEVYERGGVFLFDEFDAADGSILLCVNQALANKRCSVPNRPENPWAIRHRDFICVAAANTFGNGADRVYVNRNELDGATKERFRIGQIHVDYDRDVERGLIESRELLSICWKIREKIDAAKLRKIMSMRFMLDAQDIMKQSGWTIEKCLENYFADWSRDERSKVQ